MKINYEQIVTTILGGYIGALIPNKYSNIHRLLMAVIIGSLFSKCIYGDFDIGYQWTISDIYYWFFTIIESVIGGLISIELQKLNE